MFLNGSVLSLQKLESFSSFYQYITCSVIPLWFLLSSNSPVPAKSLPLSCQALSQRKGPSGGLPAQGLRTVFHILFWGWLPLHLIFKISLLQTLLWLYSIHRTRPSNPSWNTGGHHYWILWPEITIHPGFLSIKGMFPAPVLPVSSLLADSTVLLQEENLVSIPDITGCP